MSKIYLFSCEAVSSAQDNLAIFAGGRFSVEGNGALSLVSSFVEDEGRFRTFSCV
jgi:hypothetical protein